MVSCARSSRSWPSGRCSRGSAARLDAATLGTLPFFVEGAAFALGALSVIAPPVGPIALALLLWLLFAGRRREGQKYAGLRILR